MWWLIIVALIFVFYIISINFKSKESNKPIPKNRTQNIKIRVIETEGCTPTLLAYKCQFKRDDNFSDWIDFLSVWHDHEVRYEIKRSPHAFSHFKKFKTYDECVAYNNSVYAKQKEKQEERKRNSEIYLK